MDGIERYTSSDLVQRQAAQALLECNAYTQHFGLALTPAQAIDLVKVHTQALHNTGRVEFGGGIVQDLLRAFCDSPYLGHDCYAQVLAELTQLFYDYKNETMDLLSDEALIAFMKDAFNGDCHGSITLLESRALYRLAKNLRAGRPAEEDEGEVDAQ